MDEINGRDFLAFQTRRKVVNLCKQFFFILEDLRDNREILSDEEYQRKRKRILDFGNDAIRELEGYISQVEVKIKTEITFPKH